MTVDYADDIDGTVISAEQDGKSAQAFSVYYGWLVEYEGRRIKVRGSNENAESVMACLLSGEALPSYASERS